MAATVYDVAKKAGISVATVSRYLNKHSIREKNAINIQKAIEELGYTENIIAKGLKNNRSMTIGVVVPYISNAFPMLIASSIEMEIENYNYSMTLCNYMNKPDRLEEKLKFLRDRSVDGIILHVTNIYESKMLVQCIDEGIPIVTVNSRMNVNRNIDSVMIDNAKASFDAIECLIKANHRRIGIVNGSDGDYVSGERLKGCMDAFKYYDIDPDIDLIAADRNNYSYEGACRAVKKILESGKNPTAIYATNQTMTLAVITVINEYNLKVPEDISVIGFDWESIYKAFRPALDIIEQPVADIGRAAAALIMKRIKGNTDALPTDEILAHRININGSVRDV